MTNNWAPSQFGVKFWLGSAALLSLVDLCLTVIMTIHGRSQHADWWILTGLSRLLAVLLPWSASLANYRRIRAVAIEAHASGEGLLAIQFSSAMTLLVMCAAVSMLLNAGAFH